MILDTSSVSYDEARQFFAARTLISSNFGRQLERMRDGEHAGVHDYIAMQRVQEERFLKAAKLLGCIDRLAERREIKFAWCPDLRAFARRVRLNEGEIAVRVLYAFEQWHPSWPEKGLADAYTWLRSVCPPGAPLAPIELENGSAAQAFRVGKSPKARKMASSIIADAHVVLAEWVRIYNKHLDAERRAHRGEPPKHAA